MKTRILSIVLAALMLCTLAGTTVIADDTPGIELPTDELTPGEETVELAKGVAFTAESGIFASTYTGRVSGISAGMTAGEVLAALENKNGIEIIRDETAVAADAAVQSGDEIVLKAEDGAVSAEFTIIFMGDANGDSAINLTDASAMLKKIANWDIEIDEMASDVDGTGVVNLTDVSTLLKITAGWADVAAVDAPVLPGNGYMTYKSTFPCHQKNPSGGFQPLCLSDGIHYDLAVKFNVKADEYATSITFLCPSFADDEGSLTVSIYKWNGDYDTTVAAMPILSKDFVDFKDNANLKLDLIDSTGKGLVEGEYMWRIHDGYDDPSKSATGVGIYFYPSLAPDESTGVETFLNCKEFNIGPKADIAFATGK